MHKLLFNPPPKYTTKFPIINTYAAKTPPSWVSSLVGDPTFDRLLLPCPRPATSKQCEERIHDVEKVEEEIEYEEIEPPTRNVFEVKYLRLETPIFELYILEKIKIEVFSQPPEKKEVKRKSYPRSDSHHPQSTSRHSESVKSRRRMSKQAAAIEEEEEPFTLFDTLDMIPSPPDLASRPPTVGLVGSRRASTKRRESSVGGLGLSSLVGMLVQMKKNKAE
jgi:hypothetical protein